MDYGVREESTRLASELPGTIQRYRILDPEHADFTADRSTACYGTSSQLVIQRTSSVSKVALSQPLSTASASQELEGLGVCPDASAQVSGDDTGTLHHSQDVIIEAHDHNVPGPSSGFEVDTKLMQSQTRRIMNCLILSRCPTTGIPSTQGRIAILMSSTPQT